MLLDYGKWNDNNDDYHDDIDNDIGADIMDPRVVKILGKGQLIEDSSEDGDVEVEGDRASLRRNLIQNYLYCFKANLIEWLKICSVT
jgi:hypothetical protein